MPEKVPLLIVTAKVPTTVPAGELGMIDELLDSLVLNQPRTRQELGADLAELCKGATDPEPILHSFQDTELLRIGYDWITGSLDGGVAAWAASGRPLASYATTTMQAAHDAEAVGGAPGVLLDVRQPIEWQTDGVVPGAERIFVADLPARIAALSAELPAGAPVTVFCKSGARAAIAASLLDRAGVDVRLVPVGGAARWPEPLERLG